MEELAQRKAGLRVRMRAIRSSLTSEERIRLAQEIEDNLFRLPQVGDAETILFFYSFGSEVPTAHVVQRLLDTGKRVLLPFLQGPDMDAAELRPGDSLTATAYGPKEPANRVPINPAEIDLVIAPGLAFDPRGYRLGYGGGHYDRYLSRLREDCTRVGIGFHLQLLPTVPHGPGDERLHFVVTERETIACDLRPETV